MSGYVGWLLLLSFYFVLFDGYGFDWVLFKLEVELVGLWLSVLCDVSGGMVRVYEGNGGVVFVDSYCCGVVGSILGFEVLWVVVVFWWVL